MTSILIWLAIGICAAAIVFLAAAFLRGVFRADADTPTGIDSSGGAVRISADSRSIITVRKVGASTRVEIRRSSWSGAGEEDHWEDGIAMGPTPVEVTKVTEPELYREYMDPSTCATRKYEIISMIYGQGLTLPLLPGLHEQYLREQEKAAKARKKAHRTLRIDRSVADTPMESMSGEEKSPEPERLDPDTVVGEPSETVSVS